MDNGLLGPISALADLVEHLKMEEIKPGIKSLDFCCLNRFLLPFSNKQS
jgi:hypothetical protein